MSAVRLHLETAMRIVAFLASTTLAACGGGGDDGPLLPPLSQDIVPAGTRIDVSGLNLFPTGAGDNWVYDRIPPIDAGGTVTRVVIRGPDANGFVVLRETDAGQATDIVQRLTTAGLEQYDLLGAEGVWPGVFAALPTYIEYPTPLYPVGGERRSIRQGSFGTDVDGDGRFDDFRVEIVQVFRGFEPLIVLGQTVDAAHFTNTLAFTSAITSTGASYTTTTTEEAYFAGNVGLVRADRAATGSDGRVFVAPYTIALRSATVGGLHYAVDGSRDVASMALRGARPQSLQRLANKAVTSDRDGMPSIAPRPVTDSAAAAFAHRMACSIVSPRANAAARAPVKVSPAPMVSITLGMHHPASS
jgi:hypothetical protein